MEQTECVFQNNFFYVRHTSTLLLLQKHDQHSKPHLKMRWVAALLACQDGTEMWPSRELLSGVGLLISTAGPNFSLLRILSCLAIASPRP